MTSNVPTAPLAVDLKRRTTLPSEILTAAGIRPGSRLIARVDGPGRIVLEEPGRLLAALQAEVAAHKARANDTLDHDSGDGVTDVSLVEELFADRAADTSLDTPGDDLHPAAQQ